MPFTTKTLVFVVVCGTLTHLNAKQGALLPLLHRPEHQETQEETQLRILDQGRG